MNERSGQRSVRSTKSAKEKSAGGSPGRGGPPAGRAAGTSAGGAGGGAGAAAGTAGTAGTAAGTVAGEAAEASRRARGAAARSRVRMTGKQRREQLLDVGRALFAERGFDATSVEEIAAKAGVSKPVVYEHFGGKEGLYAVVVDREMESLLDRVTSALTGGHPRELLEQAAFALLDYIDDSTDGFRILVRDSPVAQSTGTFASLISDIASQVEGILGVEFKNRGYDAKLAPMYSQALVGMVALTGQWWLDVRRPRKAEVVAHLVNLAWNGLDGLEQRPRLWTR
ncbi:TetR/AcrR family transcriptional regulator [Allostreptomyces psammosilenae]|uniref:AcrR family transcriptional regulator n=1 Tax=Allostreptomyces psammosilenae TaxID=1892865 RepID=A0A852ZXK9_9ACTN|nr:TetR/AcrR family transcriptional regulator [Allostreptomyces psammosilenae]NYI05980.1 AcrR family transcriptional regulator [Allostreptomyces psammosilenae]